MPSNIAVKAAPFGRWTSRKRAALYLNRYTAVVMKLLLIPLAFVGVAPVLSATSEPWYPEVKFKLETGNYMDTLH